MRLSYYLKTDAKSGHAGASPLQQTRSTLKSRNHHRAKMVVLRLYCSGSGTCQQQRARVGSRFMLQEMLATSKQIRRTHFSMTIRDTRSQSPT